jgi:hypothetical protein
MQASSTPSNRWVALSLSVTLAVVVQVSLAMAEPPSRSAVLEPRWSARIQARRSMHYRGGADEALDRPAHVRAASAVAWVGTRLAVVQDDANFIALVDPSTGLADDVPLPPGSNGKRLFDDTRQTKHLKLDLEACFARATRGGVELIAFGSGSKPLRERIVRLSFDARGMLQSGPEVLDATSLYRALHDHTEFSGSELNLEGALVRGKALLLFQRGNGERKGERQPVNAIGELELSAFLEYLATQQRVPRLVRSTQYELGAVDGVRFTFTDATAGHDGSVLFLASAEDSTSSVTDGTVLGARIGELARDGSARMATLLDERGQPARIKVEGLVLDRRDRHKAWVVVDMDDPALASELLEVELDFAR